MADKIKCPVCGENNPSGLEFCQYCQSRLQPLTGQLKGADSPIMPGQIPTKKNTAELEPILPQWLRDARSTARDSSEEETILEPERPFQDPTSDLLAGLQSQKDDENEALPDWLAGLAGNQSHTQEAQSNEMRWVELGRGNEIEEPAADEAPNENDTLSWLRGATTEPSHDGPAADSFIATPDTPDWLLQMAAEHEAGSIKPAAPEPASDNNSPDWLHQLGEEASKDGGVFFSETSEQTDEQAAFSLPVEEPSWLSSLRGAQDAATDQSNSTPTPAMPDDAFSKFFEPQTKDGSELPIKAEAPDWMANAAAVFEPALSESDLANADIPDWMKPADSPSESGQDWLTSFRSSPAEENPSSTPAFIEDSKPSVPAFTNEGNAEIDSLFTDLPDWLSNSSQETPASESEQEEPAQPGALPSWVQAMRPIESDEAPIPSPTGPVESAGALAGLKGVLPPGFLPTGKPKIQSIKIQADEEQQAHAALLEQILAAETSPDPIHTISVLPASKGLRWFIIILLFVLIGTSAFLKTQIFSTPSGLPFETDAAMRIVQSIPDGAPILAAVEYEAARAGEMEAAALPLLGMFKNPAMTFVSTNETGGALAERLAGGSVQNNLGYLPGGKMGIRAFSKDPSLAFPGLAGFQSVSQFAALVIITDNADSARAWVEQTSSTRGNIPILVVSSAQASPMIQPYYSSQQISGLVSGLSGGAVIERAMNQPGLSRTYWDSYNIGILLAAALIVGGSLVSLAMKLRDRSSMTGEEN